MNYYINRLNELAKEASINDEVPIACLIIKDNQIIGEGVNNREKNNLIHGHAEINAINQASNKLGSWKLDDCIMYVSTEPCLMCYGAIKQSRIKKYMLLVNKKVVRNNLLIVILKMMIN